ncbi:MAG: hypothetical protein L0Y55_05630, partial [Anaerolineales bacterium]|nr:hypothetical protein [Anaerolineales bacterium]
MITSPSNPKVKLVRALARKKERYAARQFVLEGARLVDDALAAHIAPTLVLHTAQIENDARALLDQLRVATPEVFAVSDAVMQDLATTETPQGILAVVPFPDLPLPAQPQFVLILDAVRDP